MLPPIYMSKDAHKSITFKQCVRGWRDTLTGVLELEAKGATDQQLIG